MPSLSAHCVVAEATRNRALGTQHLAMRVIAFHVADELAVEVELVQVAAAVVQVVQVLAGRQSQRGQVAQWVVVVGQGALGGGLLDQATQQVVGKFEFFFKNAELLAVSGRQAFDGQQAIGVVVGVILAGIGIAFGQKSADGIAFKFGLSLWSFGAFAVADFVDSRQVVDALFFNINAGRMAGELIQRV